MKKYIFIALAFFGLSALAGMSASDSAEGFNGSVELKWRHVADSNWGNSTYHGRVGWTGNVNDVIQWGVGFSTPVEVAFSNYGFEKIHWEQAYVKYTPAEAFSIKAGKHKKYSGFNKYGVLVDDDELYPTGVMAKFKHEVAAATNVYVKAAWHKIGADYAGVWGANDGVASGWVGVHSDGDSWNYGVGVGAQSNQVGDGDKTIVVVKGGVGSSDLVGIPVGVFGVWASDAGEFGAGTYTAGVHVGDTSETHGYSVAVSYYNISANDWNTAIVDDDYIVQAAPVAPADGGEAAGTGEGVNASGVAAKAQYNLFDNTNIAIKYNWAMAEGDGEDSQGIVGELTFNF